MVIIVWCDVRAVTVLDTLQLNDFSFYGLHQLICSVKKRSSVSFAIHFFRRTKVSFDGSVSKRQIRISDAEEYQNPVYRDIENKDREWNITAI